MKIVEFLTERNVDFKLIPHRETHDAQRMAEALHVPGCEVAKTVMLRADSGYRYIVAVLPASMRIDLEKASQMLGGSRLELATEQEISQHCPDCEIGALPPFGSEYDMRTIVDENLVVDEEIVFESNTHDEAVRIKFVDFRNLEQPLVGSFAVHCCQKV